MARPVRFLLLSAALALPLASPAQPVPSAALDALAVKVSTEGSARVIVGVDTSSVGTGRATRLSASSPASTRATIQAAQDRAIATLLSSPGTRVHARFEHVPHLVAEVDAAALARLRASPLVKNLQEDLPVPPTLLQSTAQIHAPEVWNSGRTGSGWTVAVLDTGVDRNHPFLTGKVVSEACYSSTTTQSQSVCPGGAAESFVAGSGLNCNTSISGCTHGTHVAGIVAGTGAPDGSHGVAKGANLIAIQVFSYFPSANSVMSYTSDQIKALERVYALRDTYKIAAVNMSLGGGQYTATCDGTQSALKAAIDNLRSVGIATVIASGNDGFRNAIAAPACISTAVSVGSTCDAGPDGSACATGTGGVASYSNIAPFVSLLAPGSYINSSVPGSGYATMQGTSMAAPHVAGAWALLKQSQPTLSVADGLSLLRANGVPTNDTRSGASVSGLPRLDVAALAGNAYAMEVGKAGTGQGTVTSAPAGIACGSDCAETYAEGTTVTLNPAAAPGSAFAGWSGACSGTGACTVTMSQARTVTASFTALPYTLTVTRSGTASGSVASSVSGISCGSTCSAVFGGGTVVTLTATPATGAKFTGWSGSCTGTSTTCAVEMTAARSVTASFAPQTYTLAVAKSGTGSGAVTSSPSGISCGSTCSRAMAYGTSVTLSAVPASGSVFAGWSGACSGTASCTVSMNDSRSVGAVFTRVSQKLTVTRSGNGTLAASSAGISCGSACSATLSVGTVVSLTATPTAGNYFVGWSGACTGTGACDVTLGDAAVSVTGTFKAITYPLTVSRSIVSTGNGSVVSSPSGISCGSTCTKAFNSGTTVTLSARPASGSRFTGWSGACSGTSTSCSVSMTEARSAVATFAPL